MRISSPPQTSAVLDFPFCCGRIVWAQEEKTACWKEKKPINAVAECYLYHAHCGRAALTIATIPAFTAAGRLSHVRTTVARSSGICDTHMTHLSRKKVSFWCLHVSYWCAEEARGYSLIVGFCGACVAVVSRSCACE
jgi:hypothetical protein